MTLRQYLGEHEEIAAVDYTYHAKDGNIECNYVKREDILNGSWEVPNGIADCETVEYLGTETFGVNDVVAYVNVKA